MAISWYDELLGYDWVRYAKLSSKVSCVSAVVIGALSIFFSFNWKYSLAALLIGAILAIWEFPFIYYCIPHFHEFQSFVLEKCYLEREEAKAILYFFLSIVCLSHTSLNILLGLILLASSVTQVLAVLNKRADALDSGTGTTPRASSDSTTSLLAAADAQPYMFGASRGSNNAANKGTSSAPSTPRSETGNSSGGFMSGLFGGSKPSMASASSGSGAFGTFSSQDMYAEV